MDKRDLVERYVDAWNRQDVSALLSLLHPGAAYYDAYWMESCVGRELPQYFRDEFNENPGLYGIVGDVVDIDAGAVFRYAAHDLADTEMSHPIYYGAEVLTLRRDRIITVSDFYCDPNPEYLIEVARLASNRHGSPRHTNCGLSAMKTLRLMNRLAKIIEEPPDGQNATMTVAELAADIGCTVRQLIAVVSAEYGTTLALSASEDSLIRAGDLQPRPRH